MRNRIEIRVAAWAIVAVLGVMLVNGAARGAELIKPEEPRDRQSQEHRLSGEFPSPSARSYRTNARWRMTAKLPGLMDQRGTFATDPVFSFVYSEEHSAGLLGTWTASSRIART